MRPRCRLDGHADWALSLSTIHKQLGLIMHQTLLFSAVTGMVLPQVGLAQGRRGSYRTPLRCLRACAQGPGDRRQCLRKMPAVPARNAHRTLQTYLSVAPIRRFPARVLIMPLTLARALLLSASSIQPSETQYFLSISRVVAWTSAGTLVVSLWPAGGGGGGRPKICREARGVGGGVCCAFFWPPGFVGGGN